MKNKKTYYIFDIDDTLADSYEYNQQMFVDTFKPYLKSDLVEKEELLRHLHLEGRGSSMLDQFQKARELVKIDIPAETLMKENEELHKGSISKISLFSSVTDLIKILNLQGCDIAILSNRQTESLNKLVTTHGLTKSIKKVLSCTDMGYEKPDPYCLNLLISESQKDRSEFIYLGDSKTDAEFAKSAGIDFLIVDQYLNNKNFYNVLLSILG